MPPPPIAPPTAQSLENAALQYLGRFAASEASLRKTLENRIIRARQRNAAFAEDLKSQETLRAAISQIIDKFKKKGYLNDKSFAETKAGSLRRQGHSSRAITQKLSLKGIEPELVREALKPEDGQTPEDAERAAALAYAKRRRIGPYRKTPGDADSRRKDMASMAREGFPLSAARYVLTSNPNNK
ncbi:MAG: RecX family transcriptional regulator [Alphaproteobacteria bacterium]|nr:RecX family transcriptional regulator [Alphaproteobacteria bacterium]